MKRPRWYKLFADIWNHRARSILVVASITVGLLALGVIATIHLVIIDDMRNGYAAINSANIQIRTGLIDQDVVDHIGRLKAVRQAEGQRTVSLRLEASPGEWITVDMNAFDDFDQRKINQVSLVEGAWPPGDKELVLEKYKLENTNAQVGDIVSIETSSSRIRKLRVSGVVHDQTVGAFSSGPGFFLAPVQGYINQDTLEWLEEPLPEQFNILNLTVTDPNASKTDLDNLATDISDELERMDISVYSSAVRLSDDHPNKVYADALAQVLLLIGLLVVFLSGFLITNTLQALMTQQVEQIGIMKTVGARRFQIAGLYLLMILIFGVIAALISLPISSTIAFQRVDELAGLINFAFAGPRWVPTAILLQVFMAVLVPQMAALFPIWRGSSISVRAALSGFGDREGSHSKGKRQMRRVPGLSRPLLLSIRNTFRRKGRLILTLVTLSLGGAIFISAFNVQYTLAVYVDQVSRYFLADVNLTLDRPYRIKEMQRLLADVPGVARVEGWTSARSELILADGTAGESVQLLAPPADSQLVDPILLSGRWMQNGDTDVILLNEQFQTLFPDLGVNDRIKLRVNGKETEFTVIGFFQLAGQSGGFLAYTPYEHLSRLISQPRQAILFRVVADRSGMTQAEQEQLGLRIEAALQRNGINPVEISTGHSLGETASRGFATLTSFLLFMAGLTALVGSIGLAGTMSLNVMERTREIGILRAIGASNRALMNMVIFEGILIGLISWLIGVILAFPISKILSDSISYAIFGFPSDTNYTPTGFAIWLGAVIVLSVVASVFPARNAARLTIREVLAYE